jgi:arylsulfatase A-like enzyme
VHRPSMTPREAPPPRSARPLGTLWRASTAAAVAVALVMALPAVISEQMAPVRQLPLFMAMLGRPGWPRTELSGRFFAWALPEFMSTPVGLRGAGSVLVFVALAIAATLLTYWILAAIAAPLVWPAARVVRVGGQRGAATWWWERAFPLGLLAVFALPVVFGVVHTSGQGSSSLAVAGGISLLLWAALLAFLRRPQQIARLLRVGCAAGMVMAVGAGAGAALAVALGTIWRAQPPAAAGTPNIVLVSIDSLRSDHVHAYGYARETTPTIDQLARDGVLFQTVVSPTSWTLPAHLTMLTSLPPEEHGVVRDGMRLRNDATTLTEVLWQAGYATAGFVSAPYLDADYGFSQGFDYYDDYTIAKWDQFSSHHGITSPSLLRITSDWLEQWDARGRERPFFLFVHMWDVHYDYTPPPPYDSLFDPDYTGTVTGENYEFGSQVYLGMDPRDLQHIIALYDGEIRYTDLYLGKLVQRLRDLGVFDNTIVVVTADHGDEFFEHGHKGHRKTLYDESVLVPLVIRYPAKLPAGQRVESQVRLMDVGPTVLTLAGVARPPAYGWTASGGPNAAQDLTRIMDAEPGAAPTDLVAFGNLVADVPTPVASVRLRTAKLMRPLDGSAGEEFYDLVNDPGEQHNLSDQERPVETPLRQELASWQGQWRSRDGLAQEVQLSEEHQERLRALGYLR